MVYNLNLGLSKALWLRVFKSLLLVRSDSRDKFITELFNPRL